MRPTSHIGHAVAELKDLVASARSGIAFTGAGISTQSGIPDFRSPGGLWSRNRPIDFQDFVRSREMRLEAWRRKFALDDATAGAQPNIAHFALVELMRRGHLAHVITQNIDGLHQASGVPEDRLIELHGNGTYAACLACRTRYGLDWVRQEIATTGEAPHCPACGGLVKSGTISFGQPMPQEAMRRAEAAINGCDLFLALGSSLVVQPAALMPLMAKRRGAALVIINREPTEFDEIADIAIRGELGEILGEIVNVG